LAKFNERIERRRTAIYPWRIRRRKMKTFMPMLMKFSYGINELCLQELSCESPPPNHERSKNLWN
jgi:hypothetical protein